MKILLVTLEGGGNVPPVLFVIRALVRRGHTVSVLTEPCLRHIVEDAGASFHSFHEHFTRTDRAQDLFDDHKSKNNGFKNVIFGPAEIVVRETLACLREQSCDLLIADVVMPTALMAAEVMKVPAVALFHMPEYLPGPNRPPGGLGLLPGRGPLGRLRDRLLSAVFEKVFDKYLPVVNGVRSNHKLPPMRHVADLFRNVPLRLIQTSRAFDIPIMPAPGNVVYSGPVLDDPDWVEPWSNPWPQDDARPLVVVSLSTTFQNQRQAIQNCIDALAHLPVRALVTLGPAMANEKFNLPENAKLMAGASHAAIFPHARAVVTHAGHGTLMRALAHGLPMVCLPMGRDQDDNAAKVQFHKVGLRLSPKASPAAISKAVHRILHEPSFRQHAQALGQSVRQDAQEGDVVAAIEAMANQRA